MADAPELKPCPFCGGEAAYSFHLVGPKKNLWGVKCTNCACWLDGRAPSAFEAASAWNSRAALDVQPGFTADDVAAALQRAWELARDASAECLDSCGDSAVTEALGQKLCCNGHHCGCRGSDVGAFLLHEIRALTPPADLLDQVKEGK